MLFLVSVLGGIVFWRHDETPPLPRAPVHGLDDVHALLLVLHGPVDLVVVASAQVDHDVLVPERGKEKSCWIALFRRIWQHL
jgi:hypothetical protein